MVAKTKSSVIWPLQKKYVFFLLLDPQGIVMTMTILTQMTYTLILRPTTKVIYSRYNSDDPDASNDGASNYSYDGMEPPLLLSR